MNQLELITLFFHCYRVIFIILLTINIISAFFKNNIKESDHSLLFGILAWTLFIMSWHF